MNDPAPAHTRLDKWLWAARFFKHRSAATTAVDGGKVRLNGQATKPARAVKPGDTLEITVGEQQFVVVVRAIAERRGPAAVAQTLYEETAESLAHRAQQREQHRVAPPPGADLHGRPTKRDRRRIDRLRTP
jgi:ribosome-associated heat shock protein Hsp15